MRSRYVVHKQCCALFYGFYRGEGYMWFLTMLGVFCFGFVLRTITDSILETIAERRKKKRENADAADSGNISDSEYIEEEKPERECIKVEI